ncbi:DUF5050 domain-containing protein [Clostridium sp. CMCC3677]|uniref:DUF5050 domain-containing protein n=1 Tax=Clostridium sp. CMCC3677 TaxID=2949963 RepID=UPI0013F0415A|nr:DUF5050 domain-containing protein [Clostridium sp. CMCC3677]NFG62011.1 DUF5050 domain-containing protein [Clostridium botulinum]NFQ10097.1 DUF5050 domain-containing protein [Clostridium botulinum]
MIKKILSLLLLCSTLFIVGCTKQEEKKSVDKSTSTISSSSELTSNSISPFILTDSTSFRCPFVFNNDTLIFPNPDENNRISMINAPLPKDILKSSDLNDLVDYYTGDLALVNSTLYFADGSNSNGLSSINVSDKTYTSLNKDSVYSLISSNDKLFYINKNDNQKLYSYDISKNTSSALSLDSVGSFIVNGDFLIYQNLSDNSKLYYVKNDGTNRTKLTDYTANSFIPFDGEILFFNTSDNETLYSLNITTLESKRISTLRGGNLKSINNQLFFINNDDSNYLYSLSVDLPNSKVDSKPYISESLNNYYLTSSGIFYEKSININNIYYYQFSAKN